MVVEQLLGGFHRRPLHRIAIREQPGIALLLVFHCLRQRLQRIHLAGIGCVAGAQAIDRRGQVLGEKLPGEDRSRVIAVVVEGRQVELGAFRQAGQVVDRLMRHRLGRIKFGALHRQAVVDKIRNLVPPDCLAGFAGHTLHRLRLICSRGSKRPDCRNQGSWRQGVTRVLQNRRGGRPIGRLAIIDPAAHIGIKRAGIVEETVGHIVKGIGCVHILRGVMTRIYPILPIIDAVVQIPQRRSDGKLV